jgi:hypothetical protein
MFGNQNGQTPRSARQPGSEVALMQSPLAHVFVSGGSSVDIAVFLNGVPVPEGEVESMSISVVAPSDTDPRGEITAVLSRYKVGATGSRDQYGVSLFPGTVEIVARGRRLVVTCQEANSFDGLWLGLGLREDGTSSELSGVQSLRLAVSPGLLDAKLVWSEDGTTEDLLPE